MSEGSDRPRLLLVGGSGGLVGRSVLPELLSDWQIRSVHRTPVGTETTAGVEWVPADIGRVTDWTRIVTGVDAVLNLAWYRYGNRTRFSRLEAGLEGLLTAARRAGVQRFVQVSVPPGPDHLEDGLPYLAYKRRFDRAVAASGLSHRIVRPTMLFGPRDRLLTVMLRLIHRYGRFPMFGDGEYHISPIAATDLARILRLELTGRATGVVDAGGPERWRYRDLTDRMFAALGRPARYWQFGPRGSVALARLLQDLGSTLLYAYEVEWLISDKLGLSPYPGLDPPLESVTPFLHAEAARLRS